MTEKIEDFGVKIGGARKDLYALKRELRIDDVVDWSEIDRSKYITKKEVFPAMDYQELYDNGLPRNVVYFLKRIRDSIPTKPTARLPRDATDEQKIEIMHQAQNQYIKTVGTIYQMSKGLLTFDDCKYFYSKVLEKVRNGDITDKSVYQNRKFRNDTNLSSFYSIPRFNASLESKQFLYSDEEKILSNFYFFKYNGNVEHYEKPNSFAIKVSGSTYYSYNNIENISNLDNWNNDTYFALDKRTRQIAIINQESVEQAQEKLIFLAKANQKENTVSEELKKKRKTKAKPPQLAHIRPTEIDYRSGKNISGDDMMQTFNFRAGEFGNWENTNDRQENLNMSFDALKDLAKALNISDADISLDSLAIAYGARGIGNAAAHFEPGSNVINLTKINGAGSLGHEWGHALDFFIARKMGYEFTFASEHPGSTKNPVHNLMYSMYNQDNKQTEYYSNAKKLDTMYTKMGHGYWQSNVEIFARAFASYVRDRLAPGNSDYLIGHSEADYPCIANEKSVLIPSSPRGSEREVINKHFDELIVKLKAMGILHERAIENDITPLRDDRKSPNTAYNKESVKAWRALGDAYCEAYEERLDRAALLNRDREDEPLDLTQEGELLQR